MRRVVIWLVAGSLSVMATVVIFCPATWVASLLESRSAGRFVLGDAQGTVWRGSAFIGGAPGPGAAVTPLLPGRFAWRVSPLVLLGEVDIDVENPDALSQAVKVTGDWTRWQVSPGAIRLPAERLAGLGAPLNTVQLSGQMRLSWGPLQLARQGQKIDLTGTMKLDMDDIGSRLSAVRPLGAYQLTMDWQGQRAQLTLATIKGPMLLSGAGTLSNGRLQFAGKAEAEPAQEERLANLLSLLGQRRTEGNKNVIALEFK